MANDYIHVTGQDGETYEVLPTDALLSFLQRMAEDATEGEEREENEYHSIEEATIVCH
jgi:hypothetical protein